MRYETVRRTPPTSQPQKEAAAARGKAMARAPSCRGTTTKAMPRVSGATSSSESATRWNESTWPAVSSLRMPKPDVSSRSMPTVTPGGGHEQGVDQGEPDVEAADDLVVAGAEHGRQARRLGAGYGVPAPTRAATVSGGVSVTAIGTWTSPAPRATRAALGARRGRRIGFGSGHYTVTHDHRKAAASGRLEPYRCVIARCGRAGRRPSPRTAASCR